MLRVSVGLDIEQPFYVTCGSCQTIIKGKQVIWYEPEPGARLDMEAARQLDSKDGDVFDETISVHPDLPCRKIATEMSDEGGSPFLQHVQLLGSEFMNVRERMMEFRQVTSEDGAGLRRLFQFYLNSDWKHFNREGKRLFDNNWPVARTEWHYHDVFPKVILLAYRPLLAGDWFPSFVKEWNDLVSSNGDTKKAQKEYAESAIDDGQVAELQRLLVQRLDFISIHKSALLPALPAEFYKDGLEKAVSELRMPRDDYDVLKTHYVDCYELAHKVLTIIVGTINAIERKNPNSFDREIKEKLVANGMNNFRHISSLGAFDRKPNGPKRAFLKSIPVCKEMWDATLDRELRNAVGHNNARHELSTGNIIVNGSVYCSYLEFVVKTLRMTHVLLCLLHVLKMCHIQKLMIKRTVKKRTYKSRKKPKSR